MFCGTDSPHIGPGPWSLGAASALVINTIATQPGRAAVGIGVVLLGIPVHFVWRRGKGAVQVEAHS